MERSQPDLHRAFQAECNAKSRLGPQVVLNTVPAIRQRVNEYRRKWLAQPGWARFFVLPNNQFVSTDAYPEGAPEPGRFEDVCYIIIGCWNSARLIEGTSPPPPLPTAILNYRITDLQDALAAADALLRWCDEAAAVDDSAWVPATTLWRDKLENNRQLTKFKADHPEMFRNPSKNRLEIHAAKWVAFWAARDKSGFDSLDGNLQSVADDRTVQEETLLGAAQRMAALRAKKKAGKQ